MRPAKCQPNTSIHRIRRGPHARSPRSTHEATVLPCPSSTPASVAPLPCGMIQSAGNSAAVSADSYTHTHLTSTPGMRAARKTTPSGLGTSRPPGPRRRCTAPVMSARRTKRPAWPGYSRIRTAQLPAPSDQACAKLIAGQFLLARMSPWSPPRKECTCPLNCFLRHCPNTRDAGIVPFRNGCKEQQFHGVVRDPTPPLEGREGRFRRK